MIRHIGSCVCRGLGLHSWKEQDFTDCVDAKKRHSHAIKSDATPARGRHAALQSIYELVVHRMSLFVAPNRLPLLLLKSFALIYWIVDLAKRVGDLAAPDISFETTGHRGIGGVLLCKGTGLDRISNNESRLLQLGLDEDAALLRGGCAATWRSVFRIP